MILDFLRLRNKLTKLMNSTKMFKPMPSQARGTPKKLDGIAHTMPFYKKGGAVKKTGPAVVHKGEFVLTAKQAKKMPLARLEKRLTKK